MKLFSTRNLALVAIALAMAALPIGRNVGVAPAGATVGTPTVTVTPGNPAGTPSNVIATASVTVPVTVSGQNVTVYLGVAFIAGTLVEAQVDTENVGMPFDSATATAAIKAVADRVATG